MSQNHATREEYTEARLHTNRVMDRFDQGSLNARIDALIKRTDDLVSKNEKVVSQNEKLMAQNAEISKENKELSRKLTLAIEQSRAVEESVRELRQSFDQSFLRFSQWSISQSRWANSQSTSPTGFQAVAFPDGSWPEIEQGGQPSEYPALVSVQQILDLDYPTARRLAARYKIPLQDEGRTAPVVKKKLQEHIGVPIFLRREFQD